MQIKGLIYTFLIKSFHTSKSNNIKRLSKKERDIFTLVKFLKQVLVGNLLGDIFMRRSSDTANVRHVFRKGCTNAEYLLQLYCLFQQFVLTPPSITTVEDTKTRKTRQNISFTTPSPFPSLSRSFLPFLYLLYSSVKGFGLRGKA